jgi:hypothetical protein
MLRQGKSHLVLLALALSGLSGAGPAAADFTPISQPDATYTSGTALIPIPYPEGSLVTEVTDGQLGVRFYRFDLSAHDPRYALQVGAVGPGWGTPSFTETGATRILVSRPSSGGDILLRFSARLKTFGLEARPGFPTTGSSEDQGITVTFFDGEESVGEIQRTVSRSDGAYLFAATTTTAAFTQVRIQFKEYGAIARLRYALAEAPSPMRLEATISPRAIEG